MLRARRFHAALGTAAIAASLAVSGCGDDTTYENRDRPPMPIVITANIAKDKVSVSPTRFGAGPISLVVTNQTDRSQQLTLETVDEPGGETAGIRQNTGPINPRDTAELKADIAEGTYTVHVGGDDISPATIDVGRERKSSQQDLMLP